MTLDEEDVSTESTPPQEDAWLSIEDAHEGWTGGACTSTQEGSAAYRGVRARAERLRFEDRLRERREFERVYAEGKRVACPYFIAFVLLKSASAQLRLGVVASRRVGGAVVRNRAKRWLREVFRRHRPERSVGADVVLVARRSIQDTAFEKVERSYRGVMGRVFGSLY